MNGFSRRLRWLAARSVRALRNVSSREKVPDANAMNARSQSDSPDRALLAADALRLSGHLRLQVRGASMLPTLWPGDLVEIASCSLADVCPGEIVLTLRDGRFFLHRFITRSGTESFVARGDAMPNSDPPFPAVAFLGRVTRGKRSGRAVSISSRLRPLSRVFGLLFCYCSSARRIALKFHRSDEEPGTLLRMQEQDIEMQEWAESA